MATVLHTIRDFLKGGERMYGKYLCKAYKVLNACNAFSVHKVFYVHKISYAHRVFDVCRVCNAYRVCIVKSVLFTW